MTMVFYYGSGSPYAWKVHFALEHKALPYDVYPAVDKILDEAFKKPEEQDAAKIEAGRQAVKDELALYTRGIQGTYVAGPLSAADYALYPYVAFLFRVEQKRIPKLSAAELLTPELAAWKERVEALPFLARTYPPHWT